MTVGLTGGSRPWGDDQGGLAAGVDWGLTAGVDRGGLTGEG